MTFSAAHLRAVLNAHVPDGATGLAVALSGGADSASLLAAAVAIGSAVRALPLRAVHIDHGLQDAAAAFRESCTAVCAALNVSLTVIAVAVEPARGASLEAAARDARYAALAAALAPGECLLTAHHAEDQAETLLLQALRGAGLKGMSAMPACRPLGRGWHLRPLLDVPQAELLAFGASLSGACALDPMNQDARFDRSYLRGRVWPLIAARWPAAARTLARSALHAAEAQQLLDSAAARDVSRLRDGEALSVPGLRVLRPQAQINAIRRWLCDAGVEPPSTARLSEALRQIFDAKADHLPVIAWGKQALRRYRGRLFLTQAIPACLHGMQSWSTQPGARLDLGQGLGELCWVAQAGGLDAARLPRTLIVRRRDAGESLKPTVRGKTQTLQHLCQSHGVLPWMRDALPMVVAGNAVVAIGDLWLDARWRVAGGAPGIAVVWERAPIIV